MLLLVFLYHISSSSFSSAHDDAPDDDSVNIFTQCLQCNPLFAEFKQPHSQILLSTNNNVCPRRPEDVP